MSHTPLEVNTWKTTPAQKIILRIPQLNYKAASSHRIPHQPSRRRSPFNMTGQCPYWTSNSSSTARLICLRSRYRTYITMHLKYPGHRRKHNKDGPTNTPINSLVFLTIFFFYYPLYRWLKGGSPTDSIRIRVHTLIQKVIPVKEYPNRGQATQTCNRRSKITFCRPHSVFRACKVHLSSAFDPWHVK